MTSPKKPIHEDQVITRLNMVIFFMAVGFVLNVVQWLKAWLR